MTGRLLVWLAVGVGLYFYIRSRIRRLAAAASRPREAPRPDARPQDGGVMVRDRVCDTYLPRERAILHRGDDGVDRYFCSEKCRSSFLESAAP